jgi:hypothetical protein
MDSGKPTDHVERARQHTQNSLVLLRELFDSIAETEDDPEWSDWKAEQERLRAEAKAATG